MQKERVHNLKFFLLLSLLPLLLLLLRYGVGIAKFRRNLVPPPFSINMHDSLSKRRQLCTNLHPIASQKS
jgi:hypothetical protein